VKAIPIIIGSIQSFGTARGYSSPFLFTPSLNDVVFYCSIKEHLNNDRLPPFLILFTFAIFHRFRLPTSQKTDMRAHERYNRFS